VTDWRLDETAHAGPEHLDPDYVAGYERKSGFDPTDDLEILERHGLGPDSTVVDLGAGTGVFTIAAARQCRHVVAVDVSPAMTAALRHRIADLGIDNVTVVDGGFLSYEHRGEPPGFVFTRNALHQLPDFWKGIALARIAAMLPPGGILRLHDLIFDFEPAAAGERIPAWFAGAVSDPASGFTAAELATHTRDEFSTYRWLFEPMLEHAGFRILDVGYRRSAYGAYTCSHAETGRG
jgi:SAM-dependent methyltransferase